ncbi:hypothetical protein ARMSODRAFT_980528 [Armillaria solidipes]|uniref:Uncharacterized protein n=1 Tax=Armillaria solidipes TaxID=1076256 RepID=A0A2H3AVG6_9AGAR|nr:hypothetical protein ARMSODRAFT_980528 [Armillaria solidipes]
MSVSPARRQTKMVPEILDPKYGYLPMCSKTENPADSEQDLAAFWHKQGCVATSGREGRDALSWSPVPVMRYNCHFKGAAIGGTKVRKCSVGKDSTHLRLALLGKVALPSDLDKHHVKPNYNLNGGLEQKRPGRKLKTYPFFRLWFQEALGVASSSSSS